MKDFKKLKRGINQVLKDNGYINSVKIKNQQEPHFQSFYAKDYILIEVVNSHNNYLDYARSIYKNTAKILIDNDFEIEMTYPCYIGVRYRYE